MPLIEYIGHKARKVDNVAGTGLVWAGPGDRHEVAEPAAALLLRHPTVWAAAEAAPQAVVEPTPANYVTLRDVAELLSEQPAQTEYRWVLMDDNDAGNAPIVLDTMTAEQLAAFADEAGIKVDGRIKDLDKRRAAVYEALTKG